MTGPKTQRVLSSLVLSVSIALASCQRTPVSSEPDPADRPASAHAASGADVEAPRGARPSDGAPRGEITPVLIHQCDRVEGLEVAPAGATVSVNGSPGRDEGWQSGDALRFPASGDTMTIEIPGGLDPRAGTIALWFKLHDHAKWVLETTPLVTLVNAEGRKVHVIRRTLATEHYGRGEQFGYTQTGEAFLLLPGDWRHTALTWDAAGSEVKAPTGAATYYVDGYPQGVFYLDLDDAPITKIVIGGRGCNASVDKLVVFDRALNREAVVETKVVDDTLPARVARAMELWGPKRIALERRERHVRDVVRRPDAIVVEAEGTLVGRDDPGVMRGWGRPKDVQYKDVYAKNEHGEIAMKVAMDTPKEYHSLANVSSGNGCRFMKPHEPLTWRFDVPEDGEYAVLLRYSYPREYAVFDQQKTIYYTWSLKIDGATPFDGAEAIRLPQTGNGYDPMGSDLFPMKYWAVGGGRKVRLTKGAHTVTVENLSELTHAQSTYTDDKSESLDCIVLTPADVGNPEHPEHLADYQRTPEMWVEDRAESRDNDVTTFTYDIAMRSRSDAPATYEIRLNTERLKRQRASMPLDGTTVRLEPHAERKMTMTFTAPAGYRGCERCVVHIWQLENRTRLDWWFWNAVSEPREKRTAAATEPAKPHGRLNKREQAARDLADRLTATSADELRRLVPKLNHYTKWSGMPNEAGKLVARLESEGVEIDPDTLSGAKEEIDDPRMLLAVRGMLASRAWNFHGGSKRGNVLATLAARYEATGDEKYAAAAKTVWLEVARSFSARLNAAYMNEYREDFPERWGDPWGGCYAVGFGSGAQTSQIARYGKVFFSSPSFGERDILQIEQNIMYRHVRLAMNNSRKDDIGQWSIGGQMGWQHLPEFASVLRNPWFMGEYVKCIKSNLCGFADDGVDTSNWISSYGGAFGSAIDALGKVPDAKRILKEDPAFAKKIHSVATAWARACMSNGMPAADHDGGFFGWLGQIEWGWGNLGPETLEWADRTFGDERARRLATHGNACKKTGEILDSTRTVAWLDETLPSVLFPDTGLGVLHNRSGSADPRDWIELYMDYGQSGGPHGHPAKLHVLLFGHHTLLSRDCNYGDVIGTVICWAWARRNPCAHNTVMAHHRAPGPNGNVNAFEDLKTLEVFDVTCPRAWGLTADHPESFSSRRVLLLADAYYLDLFRVEDDDDHEYTWMWHNWGTLELPGMRPSANERLSVPIGADRLYENAVDGEPYVNSLHAADGSRTWEATWDFATEEGRAEPLKYSPGCPKSANPWIRIQPGEKLALRLLQLGAPGTRIEVAKTPILGSEKHKKIVCRNWQVFVTRKAARTVYTSVFETYRTAPKITRFRAVEARLDGADATSDRVTAVKIALAGGREDVVIVNFAGGAVSVPSAAIETDASHLQVVYEQGNVTRHEMVGGTYLRIDGKDVRR